MTWNYRVIEREFANGDRQVGIHEVYYDDDLVITGWTKEPVSHMDAPSLTGLYEEFERVRTALDKPTLVERDLPGFEAAE